MKVPSRFGFQAILFAIPVAGALVIAKIIGLASPPEKRPDQGSDRSPIVRVIELEAGSSPMPILAYGTARVPQIYAIRSQVSGEIKAVSSHFREGQEVKQGENLFQVDHEETDLSIAELNALLLELAARNEKLRTDIGPLDVEIARLQQELIDQKISLEAKKKAVALARPEVERLQKLLKSGATSRSVLEAAQQNLNQHQQALLPVQSRVDQIPIMIQSQIAQKKAVLSQEKVLEAKRQVTQTQLERRLLQRKRCSVVSSVDGVILLKNRETGQTVKQLSRGDVIQPGIDLGWIMPTEEGIEIPISIQIEDALWIRGVREADSSPTKGVDLSRYLQSIPDVEIVLYSNPEYMWTGRIDRFLRELDQATRMTTAIVRIEDPGHEIIPGKKIPLSPGMYCQVRVQSRAPKHIFVIPRSAIHENQSVYIVKNKRLEMRRIEPIRITEDSYLVEQNLKAGEFLVISALSQAVPGMRVRSLLWQQSP